MNLVFCCEAVFQVSNGKYYGETAPYGMSLWNRYLDKFEHIIVIARVENTENPSNFEIDSEKVTFITLPRYKGLIKTIESLPILKRVLTPQAISGRAYILRVPGMIGSVFASILNKKHIPYAVEVVGDPYDVMSSIGGRLASVLKWIGLLLLRDSVSKASSALYVTKQKLQTRYPTNNKAKSFAASDVKIDKMYFANSAKKYPKAKACFDLLAVGSLEQLYKAPDIVIKAIAQLKNEGIKVVMHWLGGGRFQDQMEELARDLDVSDRICFYGNVSREVVEAMLESADLFIHVSRTEGMPRAIIEAMAKGLPIIGSNVGGIPELLTEDAIVEPNDVDGLVAKIKDFVNIPNFYNAQSSRNLEESFQFEDSILSNIRTEFYNHIKDMSVK